MGASPSGHIKKEELDELNKHTHFDAKELKTMFKQFKKETPAGAISKAEFKEVMKQMGVVDNFLQELVFNVFDSGRDGVISYPEFVHALSIMTRGTQDEKLEFAFKMYDIKGNGYITKDDMLQIMDSFYKLVGPLVTFSGKKYESSQQLVDEFFEQTDSDGDGKISLEDYRQAAIKNPDIIQGLRLFA